MKRIDRIASAGFILSILCAAALVAEEAGADRIDCFPLIQYEQLFLDDRPVVSPSVGVIAQSSASDRFLGVMIYTAHSYDGGLGLGYPDLSHGVNGFVNTKDGRHQWIGIFKSESDRPVSGGLATFTIGCAYGYDLVSRQGLSITLGGGLAVGDFGMELPDGTPWPAIPIPLIRTTTESRWLETKFEFMTGPNLTVVVAPRSPIRLTGDMRMDRYDSLRDLIFDASVAYRPLAHRGKEEDIAGIGVGLSNSEIAFDRTDGYYRLQYYAAYAKIDLTILQASVGYSFDGREVYDGGHEADPGKGLLFSVQGILPLGR